MINDNAEAQSQQITQQLCRVSVTKKETVQGKQSKVDFELGLMTSTAAPCRTAPPNQRRNRSVTLVINTNFRDVTRTGIDSSLQSRRTAQEQSSPLRLSEKRFSQILRERDRNEEIL